MSEATLLQDAPEVLASGGIKHHFAVCFACVTERPKVVESTYMIAACGALAGLTPVGVPKCHTCVGIVSDTDVRGVSCAYCGGPC